MTLIRRPGKITLFHDLCIGAYLFQGPVSNTGNTEAPDDAATSLSWQQRQRVSTVGFFIIGSLLQTHVISNPDVARSAHLRAMTRDMAVLLILMATGTPLLLGKGRA